MAKTNNKLTEYQKVRITDCYERSIPVVQIATVLGVKESTIMSFRSRFMKDFGLPPKVMRKRTKIGGAMGLAIKKVIRDNPKYGLRKVAGLVQFELPNQPWYPSYLTIGRFLKENNKVKKKHRLKPFINEKNRLKRLEFARKYVGDTRDKLGVVIWSDETMVRSHPFTRRHSSWVDKNDPAPIQEKHHTGKYSVMFWGCISTMGRGALVVVNGTMDSKKYKKILREDLVPEATVLIDRGIPVKVMHDNAPCHSSATIRQYVRDSGIEFLDWPPYFPDLNPIENVWAWIKWKLYSEYPPAESQEELIDYVFECWESFDEEMCRRYCLDYNKRLKAVLEANGLQTKY
jgi:transposase